MLHIFFEVAGDLADSNFKYKYYVDLFSPAGTWLLSTPLKNLISDLDFLRHTWSDRHWNVYFYHGNPYPRVVQYALFIVNLNSSKIGNRQRGQTLEEWGISIVQMRFFSGHSR